MPPRFTYWTIVLGDAPTAFRAAQRDELLPMLKQLQRQNPDAAIKWFQRGRLWDSQEDADRERDERRALARERDQTWRPGGEHRDPRERYKVPRDVRRQKMAKKFGWGKPTAPAAPRGSGPSRDEQGRIPWTPKGEGGPPPRDRDRRPWSGDRPDRARKPQGDRPPRHDRPTGVRDTEGRIPWTPKGEGGPPPRDRDRKPWSGDRPDRARKPQGDRPPRGDRPGGGGFRPRGEQGPSGDRPAGGGKPWGNRPAGGDRPSAPRQPWGRRPEGGERPGGKSWGERPAGPRKPWSDRPVGRKPGAGGPPRGGGRPPGRSGPPRGRKG